MTPPRQPDDHRPSLAKKHTRTTAAQRQEALDQGLKLTVDCQVYEARFGDMTAALTSELRQLTGMGFMTLYTTVADDPDLDLVSAFVWLARRIRGEDIALADVQITYKQIFADDFDVELPGAVKPEELDRPEA